MAEPTSFGGLRIFDDVSSSDWIVANVRNFEHDVGSLLPLTFGAYARVIHPATRDTPDGDAVEVSWSEVAAANGRIAHAGMEWVAITGDPKFMTGGAQPGVWDHPPSIGSLPPRQAASLAEDLERFTATPAEAWFAVWDGYGNAPCGPGTVSLIAMPHRPMVLLRGPLRAAGRAFSGWTWPRSASLWWPDDRSWCVATDIDLMSTYVGGNAECIDAVLADNRLEAFAVGVDQMVHWKSDTINPTPGPLGAESVIRKRSRGQPRGALSSPPTVTSRGPRPTPPGDTPGR
jgi:hypothetical protein